MSFKKRAGKVKKVRCFEVIDMKSKKIKNAIVIDADNSRKGVAIEYEYIRQNYPDWIPIFQALIISGEKHYDKITILNLKTKERKDIYFDISKFFWE